MNPPEKFIPDSYDAFISYRHKTGFYPAQVIYDKLVQNGHTVFMDKHLKKGEFEPQIKEAIAKSRNFILVLLPKDLDRSDKEKDWLRKEVQWAADTPNMHFIPIFCDGFNPDTVKVELPKCLQYALGFQNVEIRKDYALDSNLDKLCDIMLKNANPITPVINTRDFFDNNLNRKNHLSVKSIDMAFHAGAAWHRNGAQKDFLDTITKRNIPTRILINTPQAAKSITQYMHDDDAIYTSFEEVTAQWQKYALTYADFLQVRVCEIPLLRVYHNITFHEDPEKRTYDRMHIKYYAYQNMNLEQAFEHELSSYSKYYNIYQKEFEFLWDESTPL